MSCLGPYYLPIPPRVWSRVENPCAYSNSNVIQNIPGDYIYLPYLKNPVLKSQYYYQLACLKKGNVLQYKANSSNLTKQQKYAQIAKGSWVNRTTTWASQSAIASDPNTKSLKRVNYHNITLNGVTTPDPLTCPKFAPSINYALPVTRTTGSSSAPAVPVVSRTGGSGTLVPLSVNRAAVPQPIVVADGGTLDCNITQNICTGEILKVTGTNDCFLTSASDVPGRPMLLCYNDNLPTVYPKNRLTYPDAGGKWPQGAKFIAAANTTKPLSTNLKSGISPDTQLINNYNIYTIDTTSFDDYVVDQIGIYVIYNFHGKRVILPSDRQNTSFYTFFNTTSKPIVLYSPNEGIYNEFYSSKNGTDNMILAANQSITLTSISNGKKMTYFGDFNVIKTRKQRSNINPVIKYINNVTESDQYKLYGEVGLSGEVADYYIINNYTSTADIILDDNLPNLTIIKIYNLSNNQVNVSSSDLIYNTYYQPMGATTYLLDIFAHYAFQLVQTENSKMWIMNSNNSQSKSASPYYIANVHGDFTTSSNTIYIVESITGNIIIPNNVENLDNIQIFNISDNTVHIQTSDGLTLMYNDFFAPMHRDGITELTLSSNSAINFQFMNVTNTPAQISVGEINDPFWTFTLC